VSGGGGVRESAAELIEEALAEYPARRAFPGIPRNRSDDAPTLPARGRPREDVEGMKGGGK